MMSGMTMQVLEGAKARMSALGADLVQAPDEMRGLLADASTALMTGSGVRAATYLLILMLIGCGVEWLYWTYAHAPLRAIESIAVSSPRHAFRLGLRRMALLGSGLVLFAVATIAASAAFTWPKGVQELVVAATLFVVVLRLAWLAVTILLAPGYGRLRLLPVEQRKVRWLAATVMGVAGLMAIGGFVPDLLENIGGAPHSAGTLRLKVATLTALILVIAAFAFVEETAPAGRAFLGRRLPKFPNSIVAALMVVAVYVLWLFGAATAARIAATVAAVVVLQMALRKLVFFFWHDAAESTLLPSIVLSTARFLVVLLGLGACAVILHAPMNELAASQNYFVRFGFQLLGVAALALFANVVWMAIKTGIDHRLARIGPHDPHGQPNPNARLLTLLPLLRTTAAVLLGLMLVLSSLWALGIEITPLLAGAGVVGLALGFGAQALVRDIIAGVFFLAEDVFRVGEYVESGTTTKGTVERITLRTVALRHHNGPLHFVPYGSLGTVRNNSRDWVIEKFNIPLPIDVDSEKIRKMIKKIGQEMLLDPDIGHMLREPLKSKLYRIDPGVKIFRCKFQTAPGNQFDVRAQAFRRIEAALKALGIAFASGQTIIIERPAAVAPAG